MKFCKCLRQVVETSDPEWAPYCTNYKLLKKLIKEISASAVVPSSSALPSNSVDVTRCSERSVSIQKRGEESSERMPATTTTGSLRTHLDIFKINNNEEKEALERPRKLVKSMASSPGEVAFFRLLHAEYKKSTHFFDMTQEEFIIREHRVQEGIDIMERAVIKKSNPVTVTKQWKGSLQSLSHLYKDLLQFETFAIMTYCSFSKILKKHDKVTGYNTRNAFMNNIVNNANFVSYPVVLEMIQRCEKSYDQVIKRLRERRREEPREDVNLFISMIRRMNDQLLMNSDLNKGKNSAKDCVEKKSPKEKSSKEAHLGQGTKRRRDELMRR